MTESAFTSCLLDSQQELMPLLPGANIAQVAQIRSNGLYQFRKMGLPTMRDEPWKYTNVRSIDKNMFHFSTRPENGIEALDLATHQIESCCSHQMTFVDGWYSPEHSSMDELADSVELTSLGHLMESCGEAASPTEIQRIMGYLETVSNNAQHGFQAINAALVADGAVVKISKSVEKPIELLFISTGSSKQLLNLNNFIFAHNSAVATVIERYISLDSTEYLTNTSLIVELGENSSLSHYRIQNESKSAFHIGRTEVQQDSGSKFRSCSISLGAAIGRHEIEQKLREEKTECELNGLYIGQEKQHIDNYTNIVHEHPDGTSSENYAGILDGNSRAVFHGRIVVAPGAVGTNARQQNRNLLLSRNAEADTKPQLEIYADDVKCAHGATVGQLDEDAVFYLRSRGMGEEEARAVLTQAFTAELVDGIENEHVREHVAQLVRTTLHTEINLKKAA